MDTNIKKVKEWLKKKEQPKKYRNSYIGVSGNFRTIDANVLLTHIQRNYTLVEKKKNKFLT